MIRQVENVGIHESKDRISTETNNTYVNNSLNAILKLNQGMEKNA